MGVRVEGARASGSEPTSEPSVKEGDAPAGTRALDGEGAGEQRRRRREAELGRRKQPRLGRRKEVRMDRGGPLHCDAVRCYFPCWVRASAGGLVRGYAAWAGLRACRGRERVLVGTHHGGHISKPLLFSSLSLTQSSIIIDFR